jgi:hypothetical protein
LGDFFTNASGIFMTFIIEVARLLGYYFSTAQVVYWFSQMLGWATFWAILSQTHLVTVHLSQLPNFARKLACRPYTPVSKDLLLPDLKPSKTVVNFGGFENQQRRAGSRRSQVRIPMDHL